MTKLREKTRGELTAEIEDGKKKIRQFENREKCARACQGGFMKKARRNGKAAPRPVDRPAQGEYTGLETAHRGEQ